MKNLHSQLKQKNLNLNSELKNFQDQKLSYMAEIHDLKSRCKHISTTTATITMTSTTSSTTTTTTTTTSTTSSTSTTTTTTTTTSTTFIPTSLTTLVTGFSNISPTLVTGLVTFPRKIIHPTLTTTTTTTMTSTVEGCGLSDSVLLKPITECWNEIARSEIARFEIQKYRKCFQVQLILSSPLVNELLHKASFS